MKTTTSTRRLTHERFIHRVRDLIVADALTRNVITAEQADMLHHTKLLYGVGAPGVRGVCYYDAWRNGHGDVPVVEIAAMMQESWVQLAGTTIHELGHVLAGHGAGHSNDWKDAAVKLGFAKRPKAAGQVYRLAMLTARIRHAVYAIADEIGDGSPTFRMVIGPSGASAPVPAKPRPCGAGIGTKGGTSRGRGSGSRLVKAECGCGRIIRASRSTFQLGAIDCRVCGTVFETEVPPFD